MKCTHCKKNIRDKDNRAYVFKGKPPKKIFFCWECNTSGEVENFLDKASEEAYNSGVPQDTLKRKFGTPNELLY